MRQLAEVWAVLEAADRIRYNDAPSFLIVMSDGAVFPTPGGRMLLAWPDPKRGRILIHADRPQAAGLFTRGPHAATVAPVLAVPVQPAFCPVTVTWQPSVMDAPGLAAEATWRAAARSVGRAIG